MRVKIVVLALLGPEAPLCLPVQSEEGVCDVPRLGPNITHRREQSIHRERERERERESERERERERETLSPCK